jgi:tryptophan-rich sensory protein
MRAVEAHSWWRYALVVAPLFVIIGSLSGYVSNSGYGNGWFDALNKPALMPPGWVFGLTWSCLYILLGVTAGVVLAAPRSAIKRTAITLFGGQMLLNFAWSPIFFGLHQPVAGLAIILAILGLSAATTKLFARINRTAAWLMTPYLGWLCFASWLNWQIIVLNSA